MAGGMNHRSPGLERHDSVHRVVEISERAGSPSATSRYLREGIGI